MVAVGQLAVRVRQRPLNRGDDDAVQDLCDAAHGRKAKRLYRRKSAGADAESGGRILSHVRRGKGEDEGDEDCHRRRAENSLRRGALEKKSPAGA
jgi:hypothetical protein